MPKTETDRPEDKPERKLTHEEFMAELRRDPRFRVHEPRGESVIIAGQPPKKPEGA
jgi:hypothetical protein